MTSQLNVVLIRKLLGSLLCLAYSFDMLCMRDSTTSHWQTSGRLVQELNACTVYVYVLYKVSKMCLKRDFSHKRSRIMTMGLASKGRVCFEGA